MNSIFIKATLELSPVAAAMTIPDCWDGDLRGGAGSVCDRQGKCKNHPVMYRECSDSELMQKYESYDIVMSDEDTRCDNFVLGHEKSAFIKKAITHDSVIVGWSRTGVVEAWIVKQSWGS